MSKLSKALHSTRGAIDLASIMVGIIVIGIVGGVIAATVFSVIPWAQDNAAKASLGAVGTAQSAQAGMSEGKYASYEGLKSQKLIGSSPNLGVTVAVDGSCYLAVSKSETKRIYYTTDRSTDPKLYVAGTSTASCGDLPALVDTVTGGSGHGSEATCGTGTVVTAGEVEASNKPTLPAVAATPTGDQSQLRIDGVTSTWVQGFGQPGSRLGVAVAVTNNSGSTLSNVVATLSSGETVSLGSVAPGATASNQVLHMIGQSEVDMGAVRGRVTVTSGSLSTTSASYNQVTAAEASDISGNGDSDASHIVGCGEIVDASFTFQNRGNVSVYFTGFTGNSVVIDHGMDVSKIAPGETVTVSVQHVVTSEEVEAGSFTPTLTFHGETVQGTTIEEGASANLVATR